MVNNRLNNSTQKLSNAKGGAIALALAAILLPGCTTPQRQATAPAPAPAPPGSVPTTTENVVVDTPLAKAEGILDSQNRLADAELLQHR